MATLTDVTTPAPHGDQYRLDVPAGWQQGRGAFGGFTIAAMIRAIEQRVADPVRKVRSVTATLASPVEVGTADITVELLRTGNNLSAARAALVQGGEVRAHAVAVLATSRPGSGPLAWRDLEPPEVTSWRTLPATDLAADSRMTWPAFARHFEYRPIEGLPLADGAVARTVGWLRPCEPCAVRDAAYIASLIDVWWPAAFTKFPASRPCATIAYTLEVVTDLDGLDPEAPLLYRGSVPVCADGFFLETRELWGEDGRLVARNHQTFAVIA
ncbi:MAG: thioesterase family protein [Deltaproteobacteria bacterium]|nr:thioesterase family protein [Deltaproteobacteria bacterium]MDQ3295124.1 thioesterase family protein [Myxococcota bacterium]